eukprot:GGOE01014499.1.p1 GENE.GGOE01014499.1~~GGOE01014499.1.p1  ORF type:complete len:331 (+),score=105.15 GGOE01014499.1:95-1087(+)
MRAVQTDFGGVTPTLTFRHDAEVPKAAVGQVVVHVRACGVYDLRPFYRVVHPEGPAVGGHSLSGVVKSVGDNVCGFAEGDAVVGLLPLHTTTGAFAECAAVEAHFLVPATPRASHVSLAAGFFPLVVWYYTLTYKLPVRPGATVLFPNAAVDGTHLGIQLAALKGAKVFVTISSDEERRFLEAFEVDMEIIDTRHESVVAAVLQLTGGLGVDCVAWWCWPDGDSLTVSELLQALTVDGALAATAPQQLSPEDQQLMACRGLSLTYVAPHAWLSCPVDLGRWLHTLAEVIRIVHEGRVRVHVVDTFELHRLRDALSLVQRHTNLGVVAVLP